MDAQLPALARKTLYDFDRIAQILSRQLPGSVFMFVCDINLALHANVFLYVCVCVCMCVAISSPVRDLDKAYVLVRDYSVNVVYVRSHDTYKH